MDLGFFLRERIAFIRQFYDSASYAFLEKQRKIDAREDPFVPPYSENGEPPFLAEWMEADESLQVLGYSCISMLAAALHLYLKTWEAELGVSVGDSYKAEFKNGWLNGYRAYFADRVDVHFDRGPSTMSMLEEIVLVRNRIQHPDNIVSAKTDYSAHDLAKLPRAFFVNEREQGLFSDVPDFEKFWLFGPSVHVTKDKLAVVLDEVEKFGIWLQSEITSRIYAR